MAPAFAATPLICSSMGPVRQQTSQHPPPRRVLVAPAGLPTTTAITTTPAPIPPAHAAFVVRAVRRAVKSPPDVARLVAKKLRAASAVARREFHRLQHEQPDEKPTAAKLPLYPHGLQILLAAHLATFLVVRFFQLALDVATFGWTVVVSSAQAFFLRTFTLRIPTRAQLSSTPPSAALSIPLTASKGGTVKESVYHAREVTDGESVEWVNAAAKKMWRLYKEELTAIAVENLQQSINEALEEDPPPFLRDLQVESLEIGERALWIREVEKLPTRSDQDLVYHCDVRYDGDARLILLAKLGVGKSNNFQVNVPVEVSSMDIDARVWVRARLVPREPFVGELSTAFVRRPRLGVVVKPFKVVDVMEVPGLSRYLRYLFTVEIPSQYVLPNKVDVLELVPKEELRRRQDTTGQSTRYDGVLSITLYEAKHLKGTTTLGLSNPFCIIRVSDQVARSKADRTCDGDRRGNPIWNQNFEALVENPRNDHLRLEVVDRYGIKFRTIGFFEKKLSSLTAGKVADLWVPLRGSVGSEGRIHVALHYRSFVDDNEMNSYTSVSSNKDKKIASALPVSSSAKAKENGTAAPNSGDRKTSAQKSKTPQRVEKLGNGKSSNGAPPRTPSSTRNGTVETQSVASQDQATDGADKQEEGQTPWFLFWTRNAETAPEQDQATDDADKQEEEQTPWFLFWKRNAETAPEVDKKEREESWDWLSFFRRDDSENTEDKKPPPNASDPGEDGKQRGWFPFWGRQGNEEESKTQSAPSKDKDKDRSATTNDAGAEAKRPKSPTVNNSDGDENSRGRGFFFWRRSEAESDKT